MPEPSLEERLSDLGREALELQRKIDSLRSRIDKLTRDFVLAEPRDERFAEPPMQVSAAPTKPVEPGPAERPPPFATPWSAMGDREVRESGTRGDERRTGGEIAPVPKKTEAAPGRSHLGEDSGARAELMIGRTWLNRIGAVVLFLGLAFFVKYSFDQGWISPAARVLGAAAVGAGLVAAGQYCLRRAMEPVAGGLTGAGVAVLYLAAFGAYNFYHLVGSSTAFVLYTAVTVLSVVLAISGRSLPLAVIGCIGGYGTPIALHTGANQQVALLTYVLILDLGFLMIALLRRWHALLAIAWAGTFILFGGWAIRYYEPSVMWRTWWFLLAFYSTFHGTILIGSRRGRLGTGHFLSGLVFAGNATFFIGTYLLWREVVPEFLGLFAVGLALVQWLLAWRIVPGTDSVRQVRIALWVGGAAMLALAAPLEFDRYLVTVSWSVQAAATLAFSRRFADRWLRLKALALLVAAVCHFFMFEWHDDQLHAILWHAGYLTISSNILVMLGVILSAFAGAVVLTAWRHAGPEDATVATVLATGGSVLFLWLAAYHWDRYVASLCWSGLTAGWWGVSAHANAVRRLALAASAATVVKFFLWDTIAADLAVWGDLRYLGFNRAVIAGLTLSLVLLVARRIEATHPLVQRKDPPVRLDNILAWLGLMLVTWTATFEFYRAFTVDEWIRGGLAEPEYVRGAAITMLWSINAGVLWLLARPIWRNVPGYALALTVVTVLKLVLVDTGGSMATGGWDRIHGIALNPTLVAGVLTLAASGLAVARLRSLIRSPEHTAMAQVRSIMLMTIAFLVTWLPTFEIARVFTFEPTRLRFHDPNLAMHLALSLLWGINATLLLVIGFAQRVAVLRYSALMLFALTAIKMFLFDLAALQTLYRIVSFVVLGILMLVASVLYQRLASRISERAST